MITSEQWTRDAADMIDAAGDTLSLLKTAAQLWHMRHYQDLLKYATPRFRARLSKLGAPKQPVVVLDFSGVAHANWHSGRTLPKLREMVAGLYKETSPGTFIIAADTFRKPSKNPPPPPEFYAQNEKFKEHMISRGVIWEEREGREADDIMASISFTCQIAGLDCILITSDSDLYQVLGARTVIYNRVKSQYRNADWLVGAYGLTARQWPDYLTLVAECPGFGKETAKSLLKIHGDVDGIHAAAHTLTPSLRKNILEFWPNYLTARRKHFIERDIPVWG